MRSTPRLLLLTCLLMTATLPVDLGSSAGNQQTCTPHEPIFINKDFGDGGFEWINPLTGEQEYHPSSGVVGGDGSASDPYRIEGWCITYASGDPLEVGSCKPRITTGIGIRDTTKHWVVANTTIQGFGLGLRVANLTTGTGAVETTTFLDQAGCSITLEEAPGFHVRTTAFTISGVSVNYPRYHVTDDWVGADTAPVDGLTIADSEVDPALYAGIWMRGDNLTVEGTTFTDGINPLQASGTDAVLRGNTFIDNGYAAELYGSDPLVENNTITGALYAGILTEGPATSHAIVRNNSLGWLDGIGIRVADHGSSTIENNRVDGAGTYGLAVWQTSWAQVSNVTVTDADYTLVVSDADNVTLRHVEVADAWEAGVYVQNSTDVTVDHSNFHPNGTTALMVHDPIDTVLAEDNWWGCPDGPTHPECDPVTANVDYTPWLTDQDPDAGSERPALAPIET